MDIEPLSHSAELSRFQKILLITDGTVTTLLEHFVSEPIIVQKLDEAVKQQAKEDKIANVLQRKILLQGKHSGENWLYAESTIFIDRLSDDFRQDLLASTQPIGKLWIKYRLETYKRIVSITEETAQALAPYFHIGTQDQLLSRTYHVFSQQHLIMIITEKFPLCFFKD